MSITASILCGLRMTHAAVCPPSGPFHGYGGSAGGNDSLTQPYYPDNAICTEYNVPISMSYDRVTFNFTQWEDNFALKQFIADVTTRASAGFPTIINGTAPEKGDYTIAASFCTPKHPGGESKEKTVILATHGVGPARAHWNSAYKPQEYNFVQCKRTQPLPLPSSLLI